MYNIRKYLIAVVEQEPTLLSSSIKNNILFGVSQNKIKNQDINYWFKKFNLYDFIIGLPNHYDYNIGENSKNISGGQKQKLAIIRALLKRPQIIILDEPTSSLDKIGKNVLIEILQNIKKDRIIIIITHDNDIFKICDEVIELSQKIHNKTAIN
ncbi:ATP-binding cassette domain-containing protein [Thermobrachium celere]|uniref:ATP-binding cassette domain-containing protein n=1 Tax=Thermobrachium celere TaxID=53422 RepID=UPI0019413D79|nr:ATP-binding cassette domain-containing protein [Thermobrachium celere]GFR34195.1 hypothetical protein TCEA9_00070 [Thermobrachium celere]